MTNKKRKQRTSGRGRVPRCYISYAIDARRYAAALAEKLRSAEDVEVIQDFVLEPHLDVIDQLRRSSGQSDVLIFICSPAAVRSPYMQMELGIARVNSKRIIPIAFRGLVAGEEVPHVLLNLRTCVEEASALDRGPSKNTLRDIAEVLRQIVSSVATRETTRVVRKNRPLNEGKLILVGRGEVGKTSLVRRLVANTFRGDESKTQGINITTWPLRAGSDAFHMHLWDFGGQEIMHATHQFFMTERSLYLLVLNGREGGEDTDAEYWLKHIESFGGESPVILVQNKIGQHPFDLNYRGLQGRYPQIRGFVKTDCSDGTGVAELRRAIEQVVGDMPEVRMKFPADWFAIKERLESMNAEFMGYEEFRRLCAEEGLTEDADRDTLSIVLHCLGIALNYRDDSRLRETSVLRPEWVTEGIYKILNAPTLAQRRGELHVDDLRQILPKERYPREKHPFLLELMRKFSLCFAFPDEADRYLVPELLGKEEPEQTREFVPADCLNFEYHYGVLPEGLIPRFIVRSHTLSRGGARWRSGAILTYEDCKALVTAVASERRIIVRVKDGNAGARRRLLALIRYDFERIHAEFKDRLDAQPKVPLAQDPAIAVDYKKLVAFERQGVETFPELAGQNVVQVHVQQLLNGVDLQEQRQTSLADLARAKSIFFSYSHKDESLRDELETHLKLLQRLGVISIWHDHKILPGTKWDGEIDARLERASIILLLVSADFLASDYCWEKEVKRAMERHEAGDATVIPILLRTCDWKGAPFGNLQGLPKDMKAVTALLDRDSAWAEVARGIRAAAEAAK